MQLSYPMFISQPSNHLCSSSDLKNPLLSLIRFNQPQNSKTPNFFQKVQEIEKNRSHTQSVAIFKNSKNSKRKVQKVQNAFFRCSDIITIQMSGSIFFLYSNAGEALHGRKVSFFFNATAFLSVLGRVIRFFTKHRSR